MTQINVIRGLYTLNSVQKLTHKHSKEHCLEVTTACSLFAFAMYIDSEIQFMPHLSDLPFFLRLVCIGDNDSHHWKNYHCGLEL